MPSEVLCMSAINSRLIIKSSTPGGSQSSELCIIVAAGQADYYSCLPACRIVVMFPTLVLLHFKLSLSALRLQFLLVRSWPLMGSVWSRDLDTGLWLVRSCSRGGRCGQMWSVSVLQITHVTRIIASRSRPPLSHSTSLKWDDGTNLIVHSTPVDEA